MVAGSMPHETLADLLDLAIPGQLIHGNAEREVLAQMAKRSAGIGGIPHDDFWREVEAEANDAAASHDNAV